MVARYLFFFFFINTYQTDYFKDDPDHQSCGLDFSCQVLSLLLSSRFPLSQPPPSLSTILPALALASSQLTSPLAAILVTRFGARLPATIGGLLTSLGWLFTSFSDQKHHVRINTPLSKIFVQLNDGPPLF